ncbi:site-specific integrase [Virgibacillus sp. M23]|uniref:tyrosine-type recombinase/integrase n=1 Tax=Virgibacillus sp. M23 TaxID=3079030 RepID=UPI002A90A56E|nr:site-specific integrase [Virgibacillus sp. M23]MDY7043630.1 site-specific integrase [Virgibacillus sp. M23]
MMDIANVIEIHRTDVQEVYEAFLRMHNRNSNRTALEYANRIDEFFLLTVDKSVNFVTKEDVLSIKNKDVKDRYIKHLIDVKGNSESTVLTKLRSVRSFYNELLINDIQVNPMVLKVKLNCETNHHEALSESDLFLLFDFLKNEKHLGLEKYLLAKTLFHTANRKTATINMTWKDNLIQKEDYATGLKVWIIRVKDKGNKWIEKPISDEFYEELSQLNKGQEKVFDISAKTLERSLKRFSKELGKEVKPHSLKATAITLGYRMTRDLNLCRQLGSHSSTATTEIYLDEEKSYVSQLSYNMSKQLDDSILDKLTKDELLQFIRNNEDIKTIIVNRMSI